MGEQKRSTAEIQREIDLVRERLLADVNTLEVVIKERLDWRKPVRDRPVLFLGGAFVLGLILGLR
jgi:hypothetical protein